MPHIKICASLFTGTKTIKLNYFIEFEAWKEKEEATYTSYVKKQKSYYQKSMKAGMYYHVIVHPYTALQIIMY